MAKALIRSIAEFSGTTANLLAAVNGALAALCNRWGVSAVVVVESDVTPGMSNIDLMHVIFRKFVGKTVSWEYMNRAGVVNTYTSLRSMVDAFISDYSGDADVWFPYMLVPTFRAIADKWDALITMERTNFTTWFLSATDLNKLTPKFASLTGAAASGASDHASWLSGVFDWPLELQWSTPNVDIAIKSGSLANLIESSVRAATGSSGVVSRVFNADLFDYLCLMVAKQSSNYKFAYSITKTMYRGASGARAYLTGEGAAPAPLDSLINKLVSGAHEQGLSICHYIAL